MARDKVKRAFVWIRQAMRITERTTLPAEILGEIRPGVDTFGWDRLSPEGSGEGIGPTDANAQGALAADQILLPAVPEGIMRYVIMASMSHDDPVAGGLTMSMQVRRSGPIDIAVDRAVLTADPLPIRHGLNRHLLLEPGQILLARSFPAPAAGTKIFIRYRFVDIDAGEYIQAL